MKRIITLLALLLAAPAFAQQTPVALLPLPPNTVIGNPQGIAANASAIPFAQLYAVFSVTCPAHQFVNVITASGGAICAQPAFSDLSGNISVNQMNSGTGASGTTFWRGDGTWANVAGALTHTHISVGNGSNLPTDYGSLATFSDNGTFFLSPTASSTNQGFVLTQSTPTSGSVAQTAPFGWNAINLNIQNASSGTGGLVGGLPNTFVSGLQIIATVGGPNFSQPNGGQFSTILTSASETVANSTATDLVAGDFQAYSNVSGPAGASIGGILAGAAIQSVCDTGCKRTRIEGVESDTFIAGTVGFRAGFAAWNVGTVRASTIDTAFGVTSVGSGGEFNKLMCLCQGISGSALPVLSTGADLFFADTAMTIANGFNLPNVTVTGSILNFPKAVLSGAGHLALGSNSAPATPVVQSLTDTSSGTLNLLASQNAVATTSVNGFQSNTSLGTNTLVAYTAEPNNNGNVFGLAIGNFSYIAASGAANQGLAIGTSSNAPTIMAANGAEVARFLANGNTQIKNNLTFATSGDGIVGTATNDNAASGIVGEFVISQNLNTTSTVTISNASPGIISWTAHGMNIGAGVNFTTTGALPTGLTVGTNYYICSTSFAANSFAVATSIVNAFAGTCVNTSSAGSGTHTGVSGVITANNSPVDIAGIQLTAGDWDVSGTGGFANQSTTTFQNIAATLGTSSGVLPSFSNNQRAQNIISASGITPGATNYALTVGPARFSLSGTTIIYLDNAVGFGTTTGNISFGTIRARRMR